jgi:uncharacterized protein
MIAVDTNLLVYAYREDAEFHQPALAAVLRLAEGGERWGIPWPCVHEFLAVVTHPRIYAPPSPAADAMAALAVWMDTPTCQMLGEGPGYFDVLQRLVQMGKIAGPMIHDARIAALCLHHGVRELWTCDRDFSRFSGLRTRNPLVTS